MKKINEKHLWEDLKPIEQIINRKPIYFPDAGAGEYSKLAVNLYTTCENGCKYCYVPGALLKCREAFYNQVTPIKDLLNRLEKQCKMLYEFCQENPRYKVPPVELCFICDPYQTIDIEPQLARKVLEILKKYGLNWMILTKGGKRAIRDFDLFRDGDLFGSTITFLDEKRYKCGSLTLLCQMIELMHYGKPRNMAFIHG